MSTTAVLLAASSLARGDRLVIWSIDSLKHRVAELERKGKSGKAMK